MNRFISRSSEKCKPFYDILKKNKKNIKKAFTISQNLSHHCSPNNKPVDVEPFILYLAISSHTVSAILAGPAPYMGEVGAGPGQQKRKGIRLPTTFSGRYTSNEAKYQGIGVEAGKRELIDKVKDFEVVLLETRRSKALDLKEFETGIQVLLIRLELLGYSPKNVALQL
ncbi:hypothetical protein LXL04_007774 [Taraxacum kok-saghyz]